SILASNMDEVQAVFNTTRDSAGMMATAFATASETLQFKWNAALAEGRSMLIKFGEGIANTLLPMLEVATNAFHNVGNWYENLSRTGKEFLSFFTKIA